MALEKTIQKNILNYLNGLDNCIAENITGCIVTLHRPDINACYRGRCLRIEVKSPDHNYQPTKGQLLNLENWCIAGAYSIVAYSLEDVKNLIKKVDEDIEI